MNIIGIVLDKDDYRINRNIRPYDSPYTIIMSPVLFNWVVNFVFFSSIFQYLSPVFISNLPIYLSGKIFRLYNEHSELTYYDMIYLYGFLNRGITVILIVFFNKNTIIQEDSFLP